jgi:hypothetical protein
VVLAASSLLLAGASACGRSERTPNQGERGGDSGSSGSSAIEAGGTGAGGAGSSGTGGSTAGSSGAGGASGSTAGNSGVGGSIAGGSGAAGAALTDSEVCADSCAQTEVLIPSALCEDWRFPDDEHVAEYCVTIESLECAERCEQQLGLVSPACNSVLHDAIPCLARSDLYQQGDPDFECLFQECTWALLRVSAECNGLRQELADARLRWASADSDSYSYTLDIEGSVFFIVVSNGVASTVEGTLPDPATIPELFDRIEAALEGVPASVTYDPVLGYPTEASNWFPTCQGQFGAYGFSFTASNLVLE